MDTSAPRDHLIVTETGVPSPISATRSSETERPSALASGLLVLALVGSAVYLLIASTRLWFWLDEWDFLANRGIRLGNQGLFFPHNEHWSTIPIIVWRTIFNVVGVRDYWLYALPLIVAHLVLVYLLWRFMLRHQIEVWTATFLAVAFAFVGVGGEDLDRAFQLTFVASVAFGMLAIDAIETDRVWLAPLWCICSLMCSDLGVPMVIACGLVALVQRRWRDAAIAVVPAAVVFVVWYLAIGYQGTTSDPSFGTLRIGQLWSYVWTGLTTCFSGFLDAPHFVGILAVVVLGAGAVVYRNAPAALAASVLPLYGFIALGRVQLGASEASASRYSYAAVALALPLIGWLLTQLVRSVFLRPLVMVALALLVAMNMVVLHRQMQDNQQMKEAAQEMQMDTAAFLLNQGKTYPAQFAAYSDCARLPNAMCVDQDVPTLSTLVDWVHKKQFPVPTDVTPGMLEAEEAVLNVSVSSTARYPRGTASLTPGPCATPTIFTPLTITSSRPVSLFVSVAPPLDNAVATVTFPAHDGLASTSTLVSLPKGTWLNVPLGRYPTALVSSVDWLRVCQARIP